MALSFELVEVAISVAIKCSGNIDDAVNNTRLALDILREKVYLVSAAAVSGINPCDSSVLSVNNDNNSGEIDNITNDRNSLLCSWSHEFLWEDSENFVAETSSALQDTMNEYDKLVREARQSV